MDYELVVTTTHSSLYLTHDSIASGFTRIADKNSIVALDVLWSVCDEAGTISNGNMIHGGCSRLIDVCYKGGIGLGGSGGSIFIQAD
jgi:hypothetical protein